MIHHSIFERTEQGDKELIAARSPISIDIRCALFLIDGIRPAIDICPPKTVVDIVMFLLRTGLIKKTKESESRIQITGIEALKRSAFNFLLETRKTLVNMEGIALKRSFSENSSLSELRTAAAEMASVIRKRIGTDEYIAFVKEAQRTLHQSAIREGDRE